MNTNDIDLIQRTLDGDQDAFTKLVSKYQKWVHALVWRKIGDFHIAEELTQDVFLKVYKRLSTLKRPDHFPSWLYVIATRRCIAWLRKKRVSTKSLDAMSTTQLEELCYTQYARNHSEAAAIEQRRELVKRLLKKLPESERTVVTLFYLAEMSGEEISQFLGVSPNTVRSRLHRARQRLEKEESIIQEVFGSFQLSPNLTENIVREVAHIKPTSPPVRTPWVPWGFSLASTVLVILMVGFGTRALSRFQQPYNFDAASEMTVELIDAPIVLELARKPDALTRFGRTDTPGKNGRVGFQAEPLLIAAAQADETDLPAAKPEWIQTKGPGGVSNAGLFLTSDRTLYAITKTGLYRLTEEADAWTFVSASGPNREFDPIMAERGDTFYLLTPNELLTSTDKGKTWNSLGARPEGNAVALVITDTAMYLVLQTKVFRSEDVGNQWEPIGNGFRIWDALAIDNTLFVGTNRGLLRFTDDWEKLPVPTSQGIKSLVVAEDRLYVGTITIRNPQPGGSPYASAFYSTDLGDLWIDTTPDPDQYSPVKLGVAVEVVSVDNTLMLVGSSGVVLSYNGGETWMDPMPGPHTFRSFFGAFPTVALDENNFYKIANRGIVRSTDSGKTWHLFMTGILNSRVPNLVVFKNVLYALTPTEMLKSTDGGESWESVGLMGANEKTSHPFFPPVLPNLGKGFNPLTTKFATANGVLYVSNSEHDSVTLFRLSDAGDVLLPVEDVPDFEEDTLHTEWQKKRTEAVKNRHGVHEVMRQWNQEQIYEEQETNGTFTVADDTVFMEYRHKLYRWQFDETGWHDTGLEDHAEISPTGRKGLALAVSGNTVYAGKREGGLFVSEDNGDTWRDVTDNLAFPFEHFKEIVFAGSTVYVSTDMGVTSSHDGETWHGLTDVDANRLIMDRIAVDGMKVYGVCDSGIYEVDNQTNAWKQIIPELPHTAISFAIDDNTFYIGTKQNGVLRFQRDSR